ncbi:MAG TPA: SCO family protein [Solirubrobacteraceae bacterium]|jgi:protein SCO1/2|nr:SCO family protein [Solirubrobacteraceae bacterium]
MSSRESPRRGALLPVAMIVVILAIAAVAGLLIAGGKGGGGNAGAAAGAGRLAGSEASPPKPAPPLALRNYRGEPVNVSTYHGDAVLVTFLYTHCPDVCPLIATNLGFALRLMPPKVAARVRIVAVSVDPRGDTPKAIAAFLARHGVAGKMEYLIGSAHELGRVWEAWNVGSERDAGKPEFVNHTGIVYGVGASGKITTLYASNFQPSEIAHDVPLLEAR